MSVPKHTPKLIHTFNNDLKLTYQNNVQSKQRIYEMILLNEPMAI